MQKHEDDFTQNLQSTYSQQTDSTCVVIKGLSQKGPPNEYLEIRGIAVREDDSKDIPSRLLSI